MTAATVCRSCGTAPLANARFCHSCGAPVDAPSTPAEYKQVTVLTLLFDDGQFIYCGPVTRLLVQELLIGGTDAEVREAEAAIDRLAAVPALKGLAIQEVTLLGLRALLARGKGDERNYLELADRYLEMARSLGFEGHIAIAEAM